MAIDEQYFESNIVCHSQIYKRHTQKPGILLTTFQYEGRSIIIKVHVPHKQISNLNFVTSQCQFSMYNASSMIFM